MRKRRREIEPKKRNNRAALIKFIALALGVAVTGGFLCYGLYRVIGEPDIAQNAEPTKVSIIYHLPPMLLVATIIAVLALLFFGVRAYLMGIKVRLPIQQSRMKIKHS